MSPLKMRAWHRAGAAVLELAVILPFLVYLFAIGVDFARIFYFSQVVTNCARNGALYGAADMEKAADTAGIEQTALADAGNLNPAPTVSSAISSDEAGHECVNVTVSWRFVSLTQFPGVPAELQLTRTVQMRIAPVLPKGE